MEPGVFQAHINRPKDMQCNQGEEITTSNEKEEEYEETET